MEDSMTDKAIISQESAELIEQMMRESKIEPGTVLDHGATPMIVKSVEGADKVTVYDTETGQSSSILYYMLPNALKKKRPNGKPYFSTKQTVIPKAGNMKCWLHPKYARREEFDALGLPTCNKSNLTNEFQVRRHMQKRHPQEWATIQEVENQKRNAEERKFQQSVITAMTGEEKKRGRTAKDD